MLPLSRGMPTGVVQRSHSAAVTTLLTATQQQPAQHRSFSAHTTGTTHIKPLRTFPRTNHKPDSSTVPPAGPRVSGRTARAAGVLFENGGGLAGTSGHFGSSGVGVVGSLSTSGLYEHVLPRSLYSLGIDLTSVGGRGSVNPHHTQQLIGRNNNYFVTKKSEIHASLLQLRHVIVNVLQQGGSICFASETKEYALWIEKCARAAGMPSATGKWSSGTLTNAHSVASGRGDDGGYTLVFIPDLGNNYRIYRECMQARIPVMAPCSTHTPITPQYPIMGNYTSKQAIYILLRSVSFLIKHYRSTMQAPAVQSAYDLDSLAAQTREYAEASAAREMTIDTMMNQSAHTRQLRADAQAAAAENGTKTSAPTTSATLAPAHTSPFVKKQ